MQAALPFHSEPWVSRPMEKPGFGRRRAATQSASQAQRVEGCLQAGIVEECDLHRVVGG